MLSVSQAINIVKKYIPQGSIQSAIEYNGLYVFMVFDNDELEGQMDTFYSVDIQTGEFRDFSIITDGDISEINNLFLNDPIYKS